MKSKTYHPIGLFAGAACLFAVAAGPARAVDAPFVQTGGFYSNGLTDNLASFQNYFVGAAVFTGATSRSPERRSFFIFDLSSYTNPIASAELSLKLVFGGLIFGGPGDTTETFRVTGTPFPAPAFLSTSLTVGTAMTMFETMGTDTNLFEPFTFGTGGVTPGTITFTFNEDGVGYLNSHLGGLVVLTGRMASWSPGPYPMPGDMESEIIWGFTDVHAGFDPPVLSVSFVPEPAAPLLLLAATALVLARRRGGVKVQD